MLVVGGQEQGNSLCVFERGLFDWLMWCVGGVTGKVEKRVRAAWALFWNELAFLVAGLDVELFIRG